MYYLTQTYVESTIGRCVHERDNASETENVEDDEVYSDFKSNIEKCVDTSTNSALKL